MNETALGYHNATVICVLPLDFSNRINIFFEVCHYATSDRFFVVLLVNDTSVIAT